MNLRNKRKVSSSTSEEQEKEFQFSSGQTIGSESFNSTAISIHKDTPTVSSLTMEKEGSPKRNAISNGNNNSYISNTDSILTSGSTATKKIKTNSGTGHQTQSTNASVCLKSAEQIIQFQQSVNNDCNIDCDGFREIFPQDLHSQLQEAIYTEQTIVLREAAGPQGFNVNPKNLFNFENVAKNHADMEIECRIQNPTVYGFNVENPKNFQHIYRTTIKEYGEYSSLLEDDKYEEIKKKQYYKDYFSKLTNGVMFAVNIDMDDQNWKSENMIIRSGLPHYLLNKGKHDILSYHRQNVMGCTQPQMYLKVAGVWTGGHQENISVRAININHGDGDSDWYCVDFDQVEKYRNYIKKKYQVDIHASEGLWFGKYNDPDVLKAGIRIKKVIQRKNDIVILAPGVLHWVRCRGRSVQTAWNFAFRRIEDIIAMNERFLYNQKINFQTIILNKSLFMDLLNFEYHNLPLDVSQKLQGIITDYYQKEITFEYNLMHQPLKSKNQIIFYDQLPAQLKHIQIYYCSEMNCAKEIFCYFGVLRSQFAFQDLNNQSGQDFCGKYYCPQCIQEMKKIEDEIVIFRKFDLNSLKSLLNRVQNYNQKQGKEQPLYPIQDLTNVGHFCGQIQNINDFIFNKDVRRLEQVYIPDVYYYQGVEAMQKFQLDLQSDRLIDFSDKPIQKFVIPIQSQRCEDTEMDVENQIYNSEITIKKEEEQQTNIAKVNKRKISADQSSSSAMQKTQSSSQPSEQGMKVCEAMVIPQANQKQEIQLNSEQIDNKNVIQKKNNVVNSQQQQQQQINQKQNPKNTQQVNINKTDPTNSSMTSKQQQQEDEKLALQLQKEFIQIGSKTRQQKNNSQHLISDCTSSTQPQQTQNPLPPTQMKGGKSMCSRVPSQNQKKRAQTNSNQNQRNISGQSQSSQNSSKEQSQIQQQSQQDVLSPNSSSTTIGGTNNITSPFIQGQQIVKVKKDQITFSPLLKGEDTQMKLEEQPPLTPKQQMTRCEERENSNQSQSLSKSNIKIVNQSGSNNNNSNNGTQFTSIVKNQDQKNQESQEQIKIKIFTRMQDDEEEDEEEEEKLRIRKEREQQRQRLIEQTKKDEELKQQFEQKEKEQKKQQQITKTHSSDQDETGVLFKKKCNLKQIANTSS